MRSEKFDDLDSGDSGCGSCDDERWIVQLQCYVASDGKRWRGLVKQTGRESNNSYSYSVAIKNAWGYTYTPLCVCITWCLIKHSG